jgi:hypothetical protein
MDNAAPERDLENADRAQNGALLASIAARGVHVD